MKFSYVRVLLLAFLAIMAFAGNSLLTRAAFVQTSIDVVDFAGIRILSGAVMLAALAWRTPGEIIPGKDGIIGVVSLFAYAAAFTIAYVNLNAASGALILFATVQLTLAAVSLWQGKRFTYLEILGNATAFGGLAWLLAPRAEAPSPLPALLMFIAGVAWGAYTLVGKRATRPFINTARSFVGAAPLALLAMLVFSTGPKDVTGIALAVASGAITSALGYVIWYAALPQLSIATAGAAQLLVPIVAAVGGSLWIGERLSAHLLLGSAFVLGGTGLTILSQYARNKKPPNPVKS